MHICSQALRAGLRVWRACLPPTATLFPALQSSLSPTPTPTPKLPSGRAGIYRGSERIAAKDRARDENTFHSQPARPSP